MDDRRRLAATLEDRDRVVAMCGGRADVLLLPQVRVLFGIEAAAKTVRLNELLGDLECDKKAYCKEWHAKNRERLTSAEHGNWAPGKKRGEEAQVASEELRGAEGKPTALCQERKRRHVIRATRQTDAYKAIAKRKRDHYKGYAARLLGRSPRDGSTPWNQGQELPQTLVDAQRTDETGNGLMNGTRPQRIAERPIQRSRLVPKRRRD